jgi:hypothetical protein
VGTADDYTDLIATHGGTGAYSYVFDGQSGYLDHALASAGLAGRVTGATVWHVNVDEPDVFDYDTTFKPPAQDLLYEPNAYRSADHDPVLVGLDTSVVPPVEPPTQPPTQPPATTKQQQSGPTAPKRIKKRGVTVLTKKNARTSAGLPVSTKVSGKAKKGKIRLFTVIKGKRGKVSVRTFGKKGWRLVLTRTAAGNDVYAPWRQRTVYVNGKRR